MTQASRTDRGVEQRAEFIDRLYDLFGPDVVLEAEVGALVDEIVSAARPDPALVETEKQTFQRGFDAGVAYASAALVERVEGLEPPDNVGEVGRFGWDKAIAAVLAVLTAAEPARPRLDFERVEQLLRWAFYAKDAAKVVAEQMAKFDRKDRLAAEPAGEQETAG